jgi:tetratricopeptide (TPR) repeat protein
MTYPGDKNLSEDIRQRVKSTYEQSHELALEGKLQEATLGCEFVLRLDPLYEPARELMRKIATGESLADPGDDGAKTAADDDGPLTAEVDDEAEIEPVAEPEFDLKAEIIDLLDRRDFRPLLSLAEEHRAAIDADPELAEAVTAASERLEAEPYVRSFLEAAEKAQRQGREDEALALLEKVRALDPSHPSVPAAAPATEEFDESNERIRDLLEEGQRASDRGDYQAAIDSWSRIFLIDIDHTTANRLIKKARQRKAESERQAEETFHEGEALMEIGATDKARQVFEKVLELDSSHRGARDYIEGMDASLAAESPATDTTGGQQPGVDLPGLDLAGVDLAGVESMAEPSGDVEVFTPPDDASPPEPEAVEATADDEAADVERSEGDEEPPPPPQEGVDDAPPGEAPTPAAKPKGGLFSNRRFVGIAAVAVLALVAVFAVLYLKRDAFFPNSAETPVASEVDALARARKLQEVGQTAMAIAQLNRLPTDHPQYAEAQTLIAQWQAPEEEPEPAGPSEEELARRDALVALAQSARQDREYLSASAYFDDAAQIAPLEEEDQLIQEEVRQRLAGLEGQIELFRQGDWEFVMPELWRLHQANPDDRDVIRLMVDSYYNLGVRDLQRGDTPDAAEKLTRAQELDPTDEEVERLLRFSLVYGERPADLLYRIFVKYLPFR